MEAYVAIVDIFWTCVFVWFYVYGVWLCSSEFISCSVPFAAVGAILLFLLVNYIRIPPPDDSVVEETLGYDPWLENRPAGKILSNSYFLKVVGHRGAAFDAPENSIAAIRKAKEKGCMVVELDVALTSDNVAIIFHDHNIDRITEKVGDISNMSWNQLKDLDISVKHPLREEYKGERIALFAEAIQECMKLDLRVILDLKGDDTRLVPIILDAFKNKKYLYKRVVVSSFNPFLIYFIRQADPKIVSSLAWRPSFVSSESYCAESGVGPPRHKTVSMQILASVLDIMNEWVFDNLGFYILGISAVLLHKDTVTAQVVEHWRRRGIRVILWTVNSPLEKQYFSQVIRVAYMTDTLGD